MKKVGGADPPRAPSPTDAPEPPPPPSAANERSVAISDLPEALQPYASWMDSSGDSNGRLGTAELASFRSKFGAVAGYRERVIAPLEEKLSLAPEPIPNPASAALARKLVHAGGTATAEDVAVVVREVSCLPPEVLAAADRAGITVVVCREAVTDALPELKGLRPRGWPPDATWDNVPGAQDSQNKSVIVATKTAPNGGRRLPWAGEGHGSASLTMHEFAHALDRLEAFGPDSGSPSKEFAEAYEADIPEMKEEQFDYLLQQDDAGYEEAYAESFARFFIGDLTLEKELPALSAYWSKQYDGLIGGP